MQSISTEHSPSSVDYCDNVMEFAVRCDVYDRSTLKSALMAQRADDEHDFYDLMRALQITTRTLTPFFPGCEAPVKPQSVLRNVRHVLKLKRYDLNAYHAHTHTHTLMSHTHTHAYAQMCWDRVFVYATQAFSPRIIFAV